MDARKTDSNRRYVAGGIAHFDVAGPAIAPLRAFYGDVFGWTIADRGPGYASIETPAGSANGALVEAEEPSLTIGIIVPDLAAAIERAVACGGSVAMPPTDNGWVRKAQIVDPAGNRITIIAGG